MTLESDIRRDYIDVNGLVAPNMCSKETRGSDNGPLFTAQYIMLQVLKEENVDTQALHSLIRCLDSQGYLHRAPGDATGDAPDDHYGLLSLLMFLNIKGVPLRLPLRCLHPMLVYMWIMSRHTFQRLLFLPLEVILTPICALIIAFSNINDEVSNTSNRMLTWTFIEGLNGSSMLCCIGAFFWYRRLHKDYGPEGITKVASIYFQLDHPFINALRSLNN